MKRKGPIRLFILSAVLVTVFLLISKINKLDKRNDAQSMTVLPPGPEKSVSVKTSASAPSLPTPPAVPVDKKATSEKMPSDVAAIATEAALDNREALNSFADGPAPLATKCATLLSVMRNQTPKIGVLAAERLVFVVKSTDYTSLVGPALEKGDFPREVLDTLLLNLHTRPLDVSLPMWKRIARSPGHAAREAAQDTLRFYLQEKADLPDAELDSAIVTRLTGQP